jgi:hypothetical protein
MDTATTTPITQRPTTSPWGWIAVAVGTVVLSVPADVFISLVFSASCSQPPGPGDVVTGRVAMLVVLLVASLPWLVMVPLSIGLVALLPAIGFVIHSYALGAWTSSLCLGG